MIELYDCVNKVESHFGLPPMSILKGGRRKSVALARGVAMYLIRVHTPRSLKEIGEFFGRDHTSVYVAVKKCMEAQPGTELYNYIVDIEELFLEEVK